MPTLTLTGTPTFNGDSTCTINATGSDRVQVPDVTLISDTQMWIAFRYKPEYASSEAVEHTFLRFGPDTNNELFLVYGATAANAQCGRDSAAGSSNAATGTGAFSAGDDMTIIGTWTASEVAVSVNGNIFSTTANTRDPDMTGVTTWNIGQRGYADTNHMNATVYWAAAGLGTLTDGDAATIHALGNTDPGIDGFPVTATFFWSADDDAYDVEVGGGTATLAWIAA